MKTKTVYWILTVLGTIGFVNGLAIALVPSWAFAGVLTCVVLPFAGAMTVNAKREIDDAGEQPNTMLSDADRRMLELKLGKGD